MCSDLLDDSCILPHVTYLVSLSLCRLSEVSRDITLGEEVLLYFQESLAAFEMPRSDLCTRTLFDLFCVAVRFLAHALLYRQRTSPTGCFTRTGAASSRVVPSLAHHWVLSWLFCSRCENAAAAGGA